MATKKKKKAAAATTSSTLTTSTSSGASTGAARTPRRRVARATVQLEFETVRIEGALLSPEWLTKVAKLDAPSQREDDYRIEGGLSMREELARYWKIARNAYVKFKASRDAGGDPHAAAETFVVYLLKTVFGFESLAPTAPLVVGDHTYPVAWAALGGRVPVVVAPAPQKGEDLETTRPEFGDVGKKKSAFALVQEFLNVRDEALWGLCCDGVTLRLVRDNASLTRPAFIEADLERLFGEERYTDFSALWLLVHESRFGGADQPVHECALERWREEGQKDGTRARDHLRNSVEEALKILGNGFLRHKDSTALRQAVREGALTAMGYYQQLLRLVYRQIFLLAAEERGLLHPDDSNDSAPARTLYAEGYSLRRLRERAVRRTAWDRHHDVWSSLQIVFGALDQGDARLGLPALAGLFAAHQCPDIDAACIENREFLHALYKLAWLPEESGISRVNWRDMGPEELGSVYESLLELVPQFVDDGRGFAWADENLGNARKTSGSYYTPASLVDGLLDSALDPVMKDAEAAHPEDPARALLSLSIVDPACGSGHFLLAAARRLASRVAAVRAEGTPSRKEYQHALREVVGKCIYGVDLNPMAVELCKVALWMEAVEPGLPLTFLNSHIQHGNALLGTTPELMAGGIPDAAWDPIEGDDRPTASALKKRNKAGALGQRGMDALWTKPANDGAAVVAQEFAALEAAGDDDALALAAKEQRWDGILGSAAYRQQKMIADAWCAAFVWPNQPGALAEAAPTNEVWRALRDGQGTVPALTTSTTAALAGEYSFFHWHLQFPQVFKRGGFDVVLGNPPWEELTPSAKEFFAIYEPSIRSQDKSGEEAITKELLKRPEIAAEWKSHCRRLFGSVHSLRESGRHLLFAPGNLGKGDFNVYRMFVETAMASVRQGGVVAQIVPETLYSGATTMAIRRALFEHFEWRLLLGLENSGAGWFPGVHKSAKFCLYAATKGGSTDALRVAFGIRSQTDLVDAIAAKSPVFLSPSIVRSMSPDALAIMELLSPADFNLAVRMHGAWPAFGSGDDLRPRHKHMRELDMTNDSALFRTDPPGLAVYEGRMVGQFDHRAKGYRSGKARSADWVDFAFGDHDKRIQAQFYVREGDLPAKLESRPFRYRVGFCNIASPTNERTLVATLVPPGTVCGNKIPTITFEEDSDWFAALWVGVANSFAMDFLARKKVSLTMTNTIIDSLPFPRLPASDVRVRQIVPLVARLCCVGREMQAYWDLLVAGGWVGPLDVEAHGLNDDGMRSVAEAEVNAAVAFGLFGLSRADLDYILDTFPIVEKRDRKAFGEYRTKRLILEIYDAMAEAIRTGIPYQTRLDPPPADPRLESPRPAWATKPS
jgi:hypothetical protein